MPSSQSWLVRYNASSTGLQSSYTCRHQSSAESDLKANFLWQRKSPSPLSHVSVSRMNPSRSQGSHDPGSLLVIQQPDWREGEEGFRLDVSVRLRGDRNPKVALHQNLKILLCTT